MSATYRALASVLMLIGFYVVALLQLAAVVALGWWLLSVSSGILAAKLIFPLLVALGAVVVALWRAVRATNEPEPGLIVGDREAPLLWATVRELAAAVGTRAPDEIRIVPGVNAAVAEDSRLLGLVAGRRTLYVGLPLLQTMRIDQLRSVLAHELGHYSGQHTRLGGVAYRGRLAILGTVARISGRNPIGWVFKTYAKLYLRVDNAASRRQELEADRSSVLLAGPEAAASALRALPALDAAWGFYMRRYVEPGWSADLAPDDLFGGFAAFCAARQEELATLRAAPPPEQQSPWDTHPPIGVRIAAMRNAPAGVVAPDPRPAAHLVADLAGAGRQLQQVVVDHGRRQRLPWTEFTAGAVAVTVQRQADRIYRAVGRFTRTPDPSLWTVLELSRTNRLGEFAEQFFPEATRREAAQLFAEPMEILLENATVRAGVARWEHSWTGPARLVGRAGEPLDLAEAAKLAVAPQTLDEALARLAGFGVDPTRVTVVERRVTAHDAELIGGIANTKINGVQHDLLILDRGLVLVGKPGRANKGQKRLRKLVESAPVAQIAAANGFLPYEEIASATIRKRIPVKAELTLYDGRTVTVQELYGSELLEKRSRDALLTVLNSVDN
ncbi:M48 family metallopeptidase [Micromonospora sagamiensis]|uniref:Zn-dependent protease with chaperone function n=1 Tax=Micromonospora sagamiensis TaxID=47875 RepID=A0A562WAY0_9ACTN|nr:M48 family metallopeptidase [Micromonospora sagamiensis]TWJ27278.1 Zn-dependent protease with chaperone function [Micromonospora sagamiensis]BCL13830.1 Zn-dependent protease [Micromonospora sagamiensis]